MKNIRQLPEKGSFRGHFSQHLPDKIDRLGSLPHPDPGSGGDICYATDSPVLGRYLAGFPLLFMDIDLPDDSFGTVQKMIYGKTVTLYELAFVLGWLFGGGDIERLDLVKKAALHFGTAFQIADDFDDTTQDISNGSMANVVVRYGQERALDLFNDEIKAFESCLSELSLMNDEFHELISMMSSCVLSLQRS